MPFDGILFNFHLWIGKNSWRKYLPLHKMYLSFLALPEKSKSFSNLSDRNTENAILIWPTFLLSPANDLKQTNMKSILLDYVPKVLKMSKYGCSFTECKNQNIVKYQVKN